jgi:hypothetical protein
VHTHPAARKTRFARYGLYYVGGKVLGNNSTNYSDISVSQVKEVLPMDPKSPRIMKLHFDTVSKSDSKTGTVEFDTEESAADWMRELQGMHSFFPPTMP